MVIKKLRVSTELPGDEAAYLEKSQNDWSLQGFESSFYADLKWPMTMYQDPPITGTVSIEDFEEFALRRLEVLQQIDSTVLGEHSNEERRRHAMVLSERLLKSGLRLNEASFKNQEERYKLLLKDVVSHYILRLAFSQFRDKQEWFIKQESALLFYKLERLRDTAQLTNQPLFDIFLRNEGFDYETYTKPADYEKNSLWEKCSKFHNTEGMSLFYRVKFYPDASLLVRNREVFVKDGFAFVPPSKMNSIVISRFRALINASFDLLGKRQLLLQKNVFLDSRIRDFIADLPKLHSGEKFAVSESSDQRLTPAALPEVWKKMFPPCMQLLYSHLLKEKHLRYWGRLQLWLFLKGAGINLDEMLSIMRSEWNDTKQFDKEHRYLIRHLYGQEGKRVSHTPYGCRKILSGDLPNPGSGESHGCPFKTYDADPLRKLLRNFGINESGVEAILDKKKSNQFELSCVEFFVQKHPGSLGDGVGNHPNSFFVESSKYYRNVEKARKSAEKVPHTFKQNQEG